MSTAEPAGQAVARVHLPCLATGLAIMLVGTAYPLLFADLGGKANHRLAFLLFWAMSSGFVRGVGFVPKLPALRWLFSAWTCAAALGLAALVASTQLP